MNLKYWHLQIIGVSSIFNFFFHLLKAKKNNLQGSNVYFARYLKLPTSSLSDFCGIEKIILRKL